MKKEDVAAFLKLMRPMAIRIANLVSRGVVHLSNDAKKLQLLQVGGLSGETIDDAEHFQPYGFSSVPLEGAEVVVLFPGGDRSHPLVIAAPDRRHRPTDGDPGDVMLYHHSGSKVTLSSNGDIVLHAKPGQQVAVEAGGVTDSLVTKTEFNAHLHPTGVPNTGPPTPLAVGTTVLKAQ